ncbi:hypothetical protein [Bacillus pseudomycoides]|uniref:DUF218 domain-containing protein n=1 Tax=Bacillus pseudomycoides TaxID=64104 RepID=A0A2A8C720_9BACI|nr:hypothetical protein [Bacillus pseudomycoides]PEA83052.1 hypothetical protein CON99_13170 [Bacillus pseudomycoides]PEM70215.1 hypothetical protein CN613_10060 [Bacillus pseudomycoides]PFZ11595.1 hypothetical protein COL60_07480 [Bacillus pseudomycoides]PFZ11992.1 hypothetical protein COL63_14565 [Bacillus pseudomycoides]PGC51227.1 hypothetical protein COM14_05800 [Bacillus pseudomycoides]
MNNQFTTLLSEMTFLERQFKFRNPDAVLYHPGHYTELNEQIITLFHEESFKTIMIPSVHNTFLNANEFTFHKELLVKSGIPEELVIPITGEDNTANDVIKNAMLLLSKTTENKNILLAGKTFFMKRFLLIATAFATNDMTIDVLPLQDHRNLTKDTWYLTDTGKKRVLNEYHMISQFLKQNYL